MIICQSFKHSDLKDGALVIAEGSDGHDISRDTNTQSSLTRYRAPITTPLLEAQRSYHGLLGRAKLAASSLVRPTQVRAE